MSSALLSVIEGNPRRKSRRGRKRRPHSRKKAAVAARSRPRRARGIIPNPARGRRRRRVNARRRRSNPRRRHRNPIMGGGLVGTLMKGATIGLGAVAANAATAAVNFYGFKGSMAGPAKIALKAGVGVAGYMALKALKQASFANMFLVGAGVAVALDAYDQFVKPAVVGAAPWLADYDYGSLQGYQSGTLQNWAPQGALGGWAPQSGLSGDGNAYDGGAYQ